VFFHEFCLVFWSPKPKKTKTLSRKQKKTKVKPQIQFFWLKPSFLFQKIVVCLVFLRLHSVISVIIQNTCDSSETCFCSDCFWRPIFDSLKVLLIIEFMSFIHLNIIFPTAFYCVICVFSSIFQMT